MQKAKLLIMLPVLAIIGLGFNYAFAQTSVVTTQDATYNYLVTIGVFVLGGITYSTVSYRSKLIKLLQGDKVDFDWEKLGKAILLGGLLGVAAAISAISTGEIIIVDSVSEFLQQVGVSIGAIFIVHKLLLSTPKQS